MKTTVRLLRFISGFFFFFLHFSRLFDFLLPIPEQPNRVSQHTRIKYDPSIRNKHKMEERIYGIFHGIGSNDIGVVVADIGGEAIGEQTDIDVPLHHRMAPVFALPNPSHSDPRFPMPLLEIESI